jgi:hypothetical protein
MYNMTLVGFKEWAVIAIERVLAPPLFILNLLPLCKSQEKLFSTLGTC